MSMDVRQLENNMSSSLLRGDLQNGISSPSSRAVEAGDSEDGLAAVPRTSVQEVSVDQKAAKGLEKLQALAEELNRNPMVARHLMFEVRPEDRLSVIKIIDAQTQETVRQIPSEEALARLEQIQRYLEQVKQRVMVEGDGGMSAGTTKELLTGILLNQRV